MYVFDTEIRELASPELYIVKHGDKAITLSPEELIQKTEATTGGKVISLRTFADPDLTWQFTVKAAEVNTEPKAEKEKAEEPRPVNYRVDPYTGEIKGDLAATKNSATEVMGWMFSLHRWLLLDKIEDPIFGELQNRKLAVISQVPQRYYLRWNYHRVSDLVSTKSKKLEARIKS